MSQRLTPEQVERFGRVALPWLPVVLRTARYLVGQEAQAQDLAQETMLKAMRHIDGFAEGTDARAWLLTILRRTHLDLVRAGQVRGHVASLEALEADIAAPAAGVHDGQWKDPQDLLERFGDQEIIAALQELPPEIRWTLLLVDVEQMDQAAAATVLAVPVGTVKSRLHRGRAMLRDRLMEWAQTRGWMGRKEQNRA